MVVEVLPFDNAGQVIGGGLVIVAIADIEKAFGEVLRVIDNCNMMCKTNAQKLR